jgi:hypothetical protein
MKFGTQNVRSLFRLGESVRWIHMPQDRVQWQALVNMVMNL